MPKSIYFSKYIKVRAFFNPGLNRDYIISPADLLYVNEYDYKLVIKCNNSNQLLDLSKVVFEDDEETGMVFMYKINEERLAMMILQYV